MQIVSRRNMLALPVERLVGTSSSSGNSPSSSSRSSASPQRPGMAMSPDSSDSCDGIQVSKKPRLFSPYSVGGESGHRNNSPTDSRHSSPSSSGPPPPSPPQSYNSKDDTKESLISSTCDKRQKLDEDSAVKESSNSPQPLPPSSSSRQSSPIPADLPIKRESESPLVLVNPPTSSPQSSSSILEKMQSSIRIIETQLSRNPLPVSALFNSHYHNDNNTTDNESGDENNRPPSRPTSSSSSTTVLSGTALSPGSESAFRPTSLLNPHHLHYHHYYHHHFLPGSHRSSPPPNNRTSLIHSNVHSPPRSGNASTPSVNSPPPSLHLKFSIEDILKPEFGKGALTKSSLHHHNNAKRSAPSLSSWKSSLSRLPENKLPGATKASTGGSSRASSVKDYSEDSNGSCTSRKGEVVDESKINPPVPQGPLAFPAWIYCTRYSDRPSSGPRSRRIRKSEGPKPVGRDSGEEKRPRTAFTAEQLSRLKQEFDENRYLTEKRRQDLARDLKLHENQIKIWFQNKRAKLKKANGARGGLAMQLMAQGLYNHSTVPIDEDDEMYEAMMGQQQ